VYRERVAGYFRSGKSSRSHVAHTAEGQDLHPMHMSISEDVEMADESTMPYHKSMFDYKA
jgi:hypothetical protein